MRAASRQGMLRGKHILCGVRQDPGIRPFPEVIRQAPEVAGASQRNLEYQLMSSCDTSLRSTRNLSVETYRAKAAACKALVSPDSDQVPKVIPDTGENPCIV